MHLLGYLHPPLASKAYSNRGEAKAKLNQIEEARQDYEHAKKLAEQQGDKHLLKIIQALDKLPKPKTKSKNTH